MASRLLRSSFNLPKSILEVNTSQRWYPSSLTDLRSTTLSLCRASKHNIFPSCTSIRPFSVSSRQYDSPVTVRVPPMAESISEGTLNLLTKNVGDYVEQDEEIATIETDKIDVSVNAPEGGVIQRLFVNEGDTVTVGQAVAEITVGIEQSSSTMNESPLIEEQKSAQPVNWGASIEGSDPVEALPKPGERLKVASPDAASEFLVPRQPLQQFPGYRGSRGEKRAKMTRIRKLTSERLKESQNRAAFLTTFNEVDMSYIMNFRKKHKDEVLDQHNVKMGFMGPIARASALALHRIPAINASIENEDTILYRDYIDLSVAVSTPKGLVTPILRNIENMNIIEIEQGITALAVKARDGKLTIEDMVGGSFTISNSGIWGSLFGTPIINTPQTAVLGIYGIQDRPIAVNGKVEIRPMMYTALTYDHRLVDGREAVTFLGLIKKYLEDPASMLLA